jgi:hypothetical protein
MKNWIVNEWKNENTEKKVKLFCRTWRERRTEKHRECFCEKSRNLNIKIQGIKVRFKTIPSSSIVALSRFPSVLYNLFVIFLLPCIIFFCLMLLHVINEWHFFWSNERARKIIIKMLFFFLLFDSRSKFITWYWNFFFISPC